jgi:hypothetical protein
VAYQAVTIPCGLRLLPTDWRDAVAAVLFSIVGVTVFILALDMVVHPSPDYLASFTSPLWPRTALLSAKAAIEEVEYRLLLMTALVWLFSRWRWGVFAAIVLAQLVNVWPWVLTDPFYGSLRYWLVGCVWGWLYWKHGFVAALFGHSACHLLLDPLLFLSL